MEMIGQDRAFGVALLATASAGLAYFTAYVFGTVCVGNCPSDAGTATWT
jgi:hypothetical protein